MVEQKGVEFAGEISDQLEPTSLHHNQPTHQPHKFPVDRLQTPLLEERLHHKLIDLRALRPHPLKPSGHEGGRRLFGKGLIHRNVKVETLNVEDGVRIQHAIQHLYEPLLHPSQQTGRLLLQRRCFQMLLHDEREVVDVPSLLQQLLHHSFLREQLPHFPLVLLEHLEGGLELGDAGNSGKVGAEDVLEEPVDCFVRLEEGDLERYFLLVVAELVRQQFLLLGERLHR